MSKENLIPQKNIKLNITAIYTVSQVNTILKNINKKTNIIISRIIYICYFAV